MGDLTTARQLLTAGELGWPRGSCQAQAEWRPKHTGRRVLMLWPLCDALLESLSRHPFLLRLSAMNAAAGWICRRCLLRSSFPARSAAFVRRQTTNASPNSISAAVLKRARAVAAEHVQLSEKLVDSFDTRTAKKAGEAAPIAAALQEWEKANEVCDPNRRT